MTDPYGDATERADRVHKLKLSRNNESIKSIQLFVEDSESVRLKGPRFIAASDNIVVVSCNTSQCVQVFDMMGQLLHTIGPCIEDGSRQIQLSNPSGVAIDRRGYIYVADEQKMCVLILSEEGQLLDEIQTECRPRAIAVCDNTLVVGEFESGRITVYKL